MNIARSTLLVLASLVSGAIAIVGGIHLGLDFAPLMALTGFGLVGLGLWRQRRAPAARVAPSLEDSAMPTLQFDDAQLLETAIALSEAAHTPWLSDLGEVFDGDAPEDVAVAEENARFASELRLVFPAQKALLQAD